MQYRELGRSGIEVSTVCCGAMAMGSSGTFGEQDDDASVATVKAALDAGITFFDTAEGYGGGHSEMVLGRVLPERRHDVVIATKVSARNLRMEKMKASCEASLRLLGTDYIDVYQVHWPDHDLPFEAMIESLERLKEEGKVRHWGVSNFGELDLTDALAVGHPEVNQLPYSLLWRAIEHDILPICVADQVSVITYSPMAQGLLTGKFARVEDVPAERLRARYCTEAAAESFAVIDELRAVSEKVKAALDANPDMWQAGEGSRYR